MRTERVEKIVRYVEQYDGGACFYVAPVEVGEPTAQLESHGASDQPFNNAYILPAASGLRRRETFCTTLKSLASRSVTSQSP